MKHSNNICENKTELNYNSVIVNESENCSTLYFENDTQNWSKYFLKVGAVSALSLNICNIDYFSNSPNFHYSEAITIQQTKVGINDYISNTLVSDEVEIDHEIAFAVTELENLNPILPKKSIKIKGRITRINKGTISRV